MSFPSTYVTTVQESFVQTLLAPRVYVLSSNSENLVVQSPYPEARISLINSTAVTNATNATNVAITDDTTTNSDYYVTFVSASSGNTGMKTSSTKLKYHPSTGALTASTIYIAP